MGMAMDGGKIVVSEEERLRKCKLHKYLGLIRYGEGINWASMVRPSPACVPCINKLEVFWSVYLLLQDFS